MTISLEGAIADSGGLPPVLRALVRIWPLAAALGVLGGAGALWQGFSGLAGPALASGAVTLLVLACLGFWFTRHQALRHAQEVARLARAHRNDPDPVLLSDATGQVLAANDPAERRGDGGPPTLAQLFAPFVADPDRLAADMMERAARKGAAQRVLRISGAERGDLRAVVHRHEQGAGLPPLLIWRLGGLPHDDGVPAIGADWSALSLLRLDPTGAITALSPALWERMAPDPPRLHRALAGAIAQIKPGTGGPLAPPFDGFAYLHPLPDGGAEGVILSGLAPALRHAEFEETPVALARLDGEGRITQTNRLARALLGLAEGESRFLCEVVEGLGRPVPDWLDDARAGRALNRPEVLRAILPAHEAFVQITLRRAGADQALIAVLSDATELKSLEARFVQSQKMQAIGQLAGGVAHDFNNLLTAISGHCDLLMLNRDQFHPDYADLVQIHQNANRAAALVRQLLAFSRKQTMRPETVALEGLLEDLAHLLKRLVGERIALNLRHDPALGTIRADRQQFEQVVMNLVVNARDAMPMGGEIRIETEALTLAEDRAIGRARLPAGDYAVLRVIDHGLGIAPDIIDKIFEPFFTTKRPGEGTGLGLSTAYGIVKQMGGYIFCDSVEGAGATFTLYFASQPAARGLRTDLRDGPGIAHPVLVADAPRPPAPKRPPPRDATREIVLLVEDETPVRAFAARALRVSGFAVIEAASGEEALEILEDRALRIDIFVTDVVMPGLDGPGWVSAALQERPGTPVVYVSGYTEDSASAAVSRTPGSVFLGKPFSLVQLCEAIEAQLKTAPPTTARPAERAGVFDPG